MASVVFGIIAWNLALSGAEKAGSQRGHSTLPGFPMPAVDPVSLGRVAGPHLSQLSTGLLEGTWGTKPDPSSESLLKQVIESTIRRTLPPFFHSSDRGDAYST